MMVLSCAVEITIIVYNDGCDNCELNEITNELPYREI